MMTDRSNPCADSLCAAASEPRDARRAIRSVASVLVATVDSGLGLLVDTLLVWQRRRIDRLQLLSLDDHMLRDIGLSRADVESEAGKPFWQP